MQDILVKGNKFINNNNDIVICAGNNISFESNSFQKSIYFYDRVTNYKFSKNIISGGTITYQSKLTSCEISGNIYSDNSTINANTNKIFPYTLSNENIINSNINIGIGNKLINSSISATKGIRLIGTIENSLIQTSGGSESFNLNLEGCKILSSSMNLHENNNIQNCEIKNSYFYTHNDTSNIYLSNTNIEDSQITYNTWASVCNITLEQCIITINDSLSLVRLSAGKAKLLKLDNCKINNTSIKSLIDMYDTSYTTPNGNIIFNNNNIIQSNSPYVFNGTAINSGILNFTNTNNILIGATILNPIYINNIHFNIIS